MAEKILTEAQEQTLLFEWAEYSGIPELKTIYAIPNGGSRNVIEAVNLKRQGVRKGIPDVCLPIAKKGYNALYIEMKRTKGSSTQKEQKEMIALLNAFGNKAVICKGFLEAKKVIEEYLN